MMILETWGRLRHAPIVLERLADALETGFPLAGCLAMVGQQLPVGPAQRGVNQALASLEAGESAGSVLRWIVSAEGTWNLIPAEASDLATICRELAGILRRRQTHFAEIWAAIRYPLATFGLALLMGLAFCLWGLPQLVTVQHEMGVPVPPVFEMLMGLKTMVAARAGGVVAFGVGGFGILGWLLQTRLSRALVKVAMPMSDADYFQIWGLLVQAGVPPTQAVKIGGQVCLADHVSSVVPALVQRFKLPRSVAAFLAHGEYTGTLAQVFPQLAKDAQRTQQEKWRRVGMVAQPLLLAGTGAMAISIFYATYLPIINVIK